MIKTHLYQQHVAVEFHTVVFNRAPGILSKKLKAMNLPVKSYGMQERGESLHDQQNRNC